MRPELPADECQFRPVPRLSRFGKPEGVKTLAGQLKKAMAKRKAISTRALDDLRGQATNCARPAKAAWVHECPCPCRQPRQINIAPVSASPARPAAGRRARRRYRIDKLAARDACNNGRRQRPASASRGGSGTDSWLPALMRCAHAPAQRSCWPRRNANSFRSPGQDVRLLDAVGGKDRPRQENPAVRGIVAEGAEVPDEGLGHPEVSGGITGFDRLRRHSGPSRRSGYSTRKRSRPHSPRTSPHPASGPDKGRSALSRSDGPAARSVAGTPRRLKAEHRPPGFVAPRHARALPARPATIAGGFHPAPARALVHALPRSRR